MQKRERCMCSGVDPGKDFVTGFVTPKEVYKNEKFEIVCDAPHIGIVHVCMYPKRQK